MSLRKSAHFVGISVTVYLQQGGKKHAFFSHLCWHSTRSHKNQCHSYLGHIRPLTACTHWAQKQENFNSYSAPYPYPENCTFDQNSQIGQEWSARDTEQKSLLQSYHILYNMGVARVHVSILAYKLLFPHFSTFIPIFNHLNMNKDTILFAQMLRLGQKWRFLKSARKSAQQRPLGRLHGRPKI